MRRRVTRFLADDQGAVTIDWIVITGFVIGLALSVGAALSPGLEQTGGSMFNPVSIRTSF